MVVSVPGKTILNFYGVNKVFAVRNGKVQERVVKQGDRFGEDVGILDGLDGNEILAVSELSWLENDMPVSPK